MLGTGAAERFLRVLFEAGSAGGLTDAELLERFVARDARLAEPAFAVLVERHGALVERVCRGVLRDEHAVEDAFQSTFLVLVKKAASLRVESTLAPWLHAVAYRVACEARGTAARRQKHERKAAEMAARAQGVETDGRGELERHLHAEIEKLTDRHRRAIVLCDLEGLTHEHAARLLGTPVGTIKSRLARGRELLRRRLSRRGLTVSRGALDFAPADTAPRPAIHGALVDQTARSATEFAEGNAGAVPASVSHLVQRVLSSMLHTKLKTAALATLSVAGIVIGVGLATIRLMAQSGSSAPVNSSTQAPARRSTEVLVGHTGLVRSVVFLPGGRELISTAAPDDELKRPGEIRVWDVATAQSRRTTKLDGDPIAMAVAPDGRSMAVAIARGEPQNRSMIVQILSLPTLDLKKEWPIKKGIDVWSLAFTPDGKALAGGVGGLRDDRFFGEVWFWDPSSGKELRKLAGHINPVMTLAFSRDDATLASGSGAYGAPVGEVRLWNVASGKLTQSFSIPDVAIVAVAFSPDGKTIATGGTNWRNGNIFGGAVSIWEVATGKTQLTLPAFPSYLHAVSYSPDGALLAIGGIGQNDEGQVVLWDTKTSKIQKIMTPGKVVQPVTAVKCLVFAPDGKTFAVGGAGGMLSIRAVDSRD